MTCPNCGGNPEHLLTTVQGDSLYECTTALTTHRPDEARNHFTRCGTVVDAKSHLFSGTVAYIVGKDIGGDPVAHTMIIRGGRIMGRH